MGNVIAIKKAKDTTAGQRPIRVLIAAHADEIGFMLKHVNEQGYIHFIQIGGINPQVCESQRVIIHGREPVRGVIVPRMKSPGSVVASLDELLIDTGLSKEELSSRVSIGDPITYEGDVSILNEKMWVGRNFDDRIGSYCLLDAMTKVGDTKVDVYAVSSVQEEVGLRGMQAASDGIQPDIGIAIDGSMARGAYVKNHSNLCEPGQGTGIYIADRLTIGHPRLVRYLFELCDEHNIAHQGNIGGGTDAAAIQRSCAGVIATTIGAPVRYMHSTGQLCHETDIEATVDLLVKFMENAHKFMETL